MSRAEIETFFESYRDAFNRLDGDAVANLWHVSSGITHPDRDGGSAAITWWSSDAPMRDNMKKLCDLYRGNDYSHANFRIESFRSLGAHHAFVDMHWDLYRTNGQNLQSFNTGYNLMRTSDGIRVLMATQYEEDIAKMKENKGSGRVAH